MPETPEKRGRRPRSRPRSRSRGPTRKLILVNEKLPWYNKTDTTHLALQASNDNLEYRMAEICGKAHLLEREISYLSRHVSEFSNPFLETWKADILTRLIEVAYLRQADKLPPGVSIGEDNYADREVLSRAYANAARRVRETTLYRLGLGDGYYEMVQHYSDVSVYRSPNPFNSEAPFARWLVTEGTDRPDRFAFWARLYPLCFGRTVEDSAGL